MLCCEPCWGSDQALKAAFSRREGVDEHAYQGEEHVLLHPDQPPPPQFVEVEVALEPGEDAFDALPLPPQPPIQLRSTLDDGVEPQPLRQGPRLPVPPLWKRYNGGGAQPVGL